MAIYKNVTGELTQQVLASSEIGESIKSIVLTNIEGTNKCTVDMYIEDSNGVKVYLIHSVVLPIGTSLILGKEHLRSIIFGDALLGHSLYIKLTKSASETPAVDLIIDNTMF